MESLQEIFKGNASTITFDAKENFEVYELSILLTNFQDLITVQILQKLTDFINIRDTYKISISLDNIDPFIIPTTYAAEHLEEINDLLDGTEEILILISVSKQNINNTRSIYNSNSFHNFIVEKELLYLLNLFQQYFPVNSKNVLEYQEPTLFQEFFCSSLLLIRDKNMNPSVDFLQVNLRDDIIYQRNTYTNSHNLSSYKFLPSDFQNFNNITGDNDFLKILEKLKIVLSCSFIANISKINTLNSFEMNIFDHKYIFDTTDFFSLINKDAAILYNIYQWIYEDGFNYDKLSLSRTIIAKNMKTDNNTWVLKDDSINHIQSAHAIYLQENVEKYIETKRKVSELLSEQSIKTRAAMDFITSSFKNNNLTLMSFFISTFILRALSGKKYPAFNIEFFYISIIFLSISSLYLFITFKQYKNDIHRNIKYFYSIKRIYKDLFNSKDLDKLFSARQLRYDIGSIRSTAKNYFIFWLCEIILLFLMSFGLTFYSSIIHLISSYFNLELLMNLFSLLLLTGATFDLPSIVLLILFSLTLLF